MPDGAAAVTSSTDSWIEITVHAWPADADAVADALGEFAPDGVSIEPAIRTSDHRDFVYEYLDVPSLLRACVRGPFETAQRRAVRRRLASLPLSAPLGRLRYAEVRTSDWSEEWKRFFHVLRVGRLVVQPSWEQAEVAGDEVVIDLDPGKAFGTGQHESTRLCLGALDAHVLPGADVLDLGTGSGILAIAAAKLGARHVVAIDIDAEAVEVARENVVRNGVDSLVTLETGSLGGDWPFATSPAASADLVVANISSAVGIALLPACAEALRPGGLWIGSGFIEAAAADVEAAARKAGLTPLALTEDADWRCLVARKA